MASTAISIDNTTGGGAQEQFSGSVTVGAGEKIRLRFSKCTGEVSLALEIVANSVTTFVNIPARDAWASAGVASGDVCRLRVRLGNDSKSDVEGVLETYT